MPNRSLLRRCAPRHANRGISIVRWDAEQFAARVQDVVGVYAAAMDYAPAAAAARGGFMTAHALRGGFRSVAAVNRDGREVLVGFGYGYTSLPGQWWYEQVQSALPGNRQDWLGDAFELSELHVHPTRQGRGYGRTMVGMLLDRLPARRVLLSTPEGDSPAWHLYRSMGFVDLLRGHLFPGDQRPFAVLGLDLAADG